MKRFSVQVVIRILLLVVTVVVFGWIFGDTRLFFNQIIVAIIGILQVWELIHFVNHTNRELSRLLLAIKHSDFAISFGQRKLGKSFNELQSSMMEIIQSYRQVKIEKEAQYHFLQMLVKQIQVGIVSVLNDDIILINPNAEKLLEIPGVRNWKVFQQLNPKLSEQLTEVGKKLLEIKSQDGTRIIAAEVSKMMIIDKPYRMITLQDINAEIEQKEIEAWHKLIRILTHEIMNSVTPVASLSETMHGMLTDRQGNQKALADINENTIEDIRFSLSTIQKRSERLIDFVDNYRKLTRVPKPSFQAVDVPQLLADTCTLMKPEFSRAGATCRLHVNEQIPLINADPSLIEQVVINLMRNSIHAVQDRPERQITVSTYTADRSTIIEVTDTGCGIPEKEMKEIFVPFFSTKAEGSGIGLSLSKQIMSMHNGRIKVTSEVDKGTSFFLVFRNDHT